MSLTKKLVLLGAPRAGKTSLALRLKFDRFEADQAPTIGAELYDCEQSIGNTVIDVLLWDTDSELGDQVLNQEFAKGSDGALVVADATDIESIHVAIAMRERFLEKFPNALAVIALNKSEDKIAEKNQGRAGLNDKPYAVRCSAKSAFGVKRVIAQLLDR